LDNFIQTIYDMNNLLKDWDIGNVRSVEPISSYWGKTSLVTSAEGKYFILKEKQSLKQTEIEFNLLSSLSNVKAPVAVPISTVNGERYVSSEGKIYCLYPKLPGKVIEDHYASNAAGRAKSFGKAIAFLHSCFMKCEDISGIQELKLIEQIEEWAIPCIRKNDDVIDGYMVEKAWKGFEHGIVRLDKNLPNQLIHRDLNPANLLFENGKLTGFVDFDMVVKGPRIFDVCYCGTSILVSGFPDSAKVEKWPDLFRAMVRGYHDLCPLTSPEVQSLHGTLAAIELLFMAFSLETHADGAAKCNASVLDWLVKNKERISF
jgi:Ser/Thr protein kinase RdoA (MazF antagonist)